MWAIIPARGGSKSIPGKNLQKVSGKALIARAIQACRSAKRVTRVIVSTDDRLIASAAKAEGAEVVDRPCDISGDEASSEQALLHALEILESAGRALPEVIVFVQCTSPFVAGSDVDGVVAALLADGADCALSVTTHHGFLWRKSPDGGMTGVNHDPAQRLRRQDREVEFLETGAVYAMRTAGFRSARHRFFGKIATYKVPRWRAIEIDEPDDLAAARLLSSEPNG